MVLYRFIERRQMQGVSYIVILLVIIAIIFFTFANHVTADAQHYRAIEVKSGDTLWSIADEYRIQSKEKSMQSFIKWVQTENALEADHIRAGQKLIIPIRK
jgi:cell division protein YceG involved in septum cleavage